MSANDAALKDYFREADEWDRDRMAGIARSERVAWRIAVAAVVLTLTVGASLVVLLPLKRVEPYVVRVDATTGIVDVVPRYEATREVDEVVTRYLLSQYVRLCEQFYLSSAPADYESCGAFNAPARNQELYQRWTPSNPQSPLQLYRDGTTLRVSVISVVFLQTRAGTPTVAQVRYVLSRRAGGSGSESATHWIATLRYDYVTPSDKPRQRQLNPMGLRILEFRREPETLEPGAAPGRSAPLSTPTAKALP